MCKSTESADASFVIQRRIDGPENAYSLRHISVSFDGVPVLSDFSLYLPQSGCMTIMGPSGLGKTTLLKVLGGLLQPDQGERLGLDQVRISVLFQENRLLPWFSLFRNVRIVCRSDAEAEDWLRRVSLWDAKEKFPGELSGGMQRRGAIARALAFGGQVYLMDEPFQGLDQELKQDMMELVRQTCRGNLLVAVTHDPAERDAFLQ